MPLYLDTSGNATLGIGICARCSRKFPLGDLRPDPNYPNLMVCREDTDEYDPYRLAPRAPDQIVLPFTRPDVPLGDYELDYLLLETGPFSYLLQEDGFRIALDGSGTVPVNLVDAEPEGNPFLL